MTNRTERGRTSSAVLWNMVLTVISSAVVFLLTYVVLPRNLSRAALDLFITVWTAANVMILVCQFGLHGALLRYLPELEVKQSYSQMSRFYHSILGAQISLWTVTILAIILGRDLVISTYRLPTFLPMGAAMLFALVRLILNSQASVLQAFRDVKHLTVMVAVLRMISLAPIWWIVSRTQLEVGTKIAACFAAMAVADIFVAALIRPRMARHFAIPGEGTAVIPLGRLAWYSLPLFANALFEQLSSGRANPLILELFETEGLSSGFFLAYQLPMRVVEFVPLAIWPIVLAFLAESYTRDRGNLLEALRLYYRLLFVLLTPVAIGGVVFADRVILVVSTERFADAAVPCQVFFALILVRLFAAPLTVSLHVLEKTWVLLCTSIVATVTNIGLLIVLVPRWGLIGGVVPVGLTWLGAALLLYWYVKRSVPGFRAPWRSLGLAALGCTPLALGLAIRDFVTGPITLAGAIVALVLLTVVGYRLFRVLDADMLRLLSGSPRGLQRIIVRLLADRQTRRKLESGGGR